MRDEHAFLSCRRDVTQRHRSVDQRIAVERRVRIVKALSHAADDIGLNEIFVETCLAFEDDAHHHILAVVVRILVEQLALDELGRVGKRFASRDIHLDVVEHDACRGYELELDVG